MPDSVSLPSESFSESPGVVSRIASAKEQTGGAEKQVAKFLENAGLAESVLQGEDFHLRIENEPYIPLVVERHGDQLYLTHYLTQNGDMFIDTEMVLGISDQGLLTLQETAVQSLGGEYRGYDRGFAQMFARNINHQGFAEAAQQSLEANTVEVPQAEAETKEASLFDLEPFQQALQLGQHGAGGDPTWDVSATEAASVSKRDVQPEPKQAQTNDAAAHGPDSELHATGPPAKALNGHSASSSNEVTVDLDALRGWYRAARDMGKGSERLEFIKKLGQLAKSYTDQTLTVPQEVQRVMAQDLDRYQVQQQRGKYVAQASQFILAAVGRSNGQGTQFQGKIYDLRQTSDSLMVRRLKLLIRRLLWKLPRVRCSARWLLLRIASDLRHLCSDWNKIASVFATRHPMEQRQLNDECALELIHRKRKILVDKSKPLKCLIHKAKKFPSPWG